LVVDGPMLLIRCFWLGRLSNPRYSDRIGSSLVCPGWVWRTPRIVSSFFTGFYSFLARGPESGLKVVFRVRRRGVRSFVFFCRWRVVLAKVRKLAVSVFALVLERSIPPFFPPFEERIVYRIFLDDVFSHGKVFIAGSPFPCRPLPGFSPLFHFCMV